MSLVDNNKHIPSNSTYWYDFYKRSTKADNKKAMLNCLSSELSTSLSAHEANYHLSSISEDELDGLGFFKKTPFNVNDV